MLAQERAKIVHEMEMSMKAADRDDFKTGVEAAKVASMAKNKPGYNEQGTRSNNVQ